MVDAPETDAAPRRRSRLDRRTVAICVCIATIAALLAGLVAALVLDDDDATAAPDGSSLSLVPPGDVNTDRLYAVALTTPDDQPTTLAALVRGNPAVVNFWQSTCAPCIEEMPLFEAARATHPDLRFVGIATQDLPAKAQALADQTGITYPWALDPDGLLWQQAKGAGMPTTILLGEDGSVVASKTGAFTSADELDDFLAKAGG